MASRQLHRTTTYSAAVIVITLAVLGVPTHSRAEVAQCASCGTPASDAAQNGPLLQLGAALGEQANRCDPPARAELAQTLAAIDSCRSTALGRLGLADQYGNPIRNAGLETEIHQALNVCAAASARHLRSGDTGTESDNARRAQRIARDSLAIEIGTLKQRAIYSLAGLEESKPTSTQAGSPTGARADSVQKLLKLVSHAALTQLEASGLSSGNSEADRRRVVAEARTRALARLRDEARAIQPDVERLRAAGLGIEAASTADAIARSRGLGDDIRSLRAPTPNAAPAWDLSRFNFAELKRSPELRDSFVRIVGNGNADDPGVRSLLQVIDSPLTSEPQFITTRSDPPRTLVLIPGAGGSARGQANGPRVVPFDKYQLEYARAVRGLVTEVRGLAEASAQARGATSRLLGAFGFGQNSIDSLEARQQAGDRVLKSYYQLAREFGLSREDRKALAGVMRQGFEQDARAVQGLLSTVERLEHAQQKLRDPAVVGVAALAIATTGGGAAALWGASAAGSVLMGMGSGAAIAGASSLLVGPLAALASETLSTASRLGSEAPRAAGFWCRVLDRASERTIGALEAMPITLTIGAAFGGVLGSRASLSQAGVARVGQITTLASVGLAARGGVALGGELRSHIRDQLKGDDDRDASDILVDAVMASIGLAKAYQGIKASAARETRAPAPATPNTSDDVALRTPPASSPTGPQNPQRSVSEPSVSADAAGAGSASLTAGAASSASPSLAGAAPAVTLAAVVENTAPVQPVVAPVVNASNGGQAASAARPAPVPAPRALLDAAARAHRPQTATALQVADPSKALPWQNEPWLQALEMLPKSVRDAAASHFANSLKTTENAQLGRAKLGHEPLGEAQRQGHAYRREFDALEVARTKLAEIDPTGRKRLNLTREQHSTLLAAIESAQARVAEQIRSWNALYHDSTQPRVGAQANQASPFGGKLSRQPEIAYPAQWSEQAARVRVSRQLGAHGEAPQQIVTPIFSADAPRTPQWIRRVLKQRPSGAPAATAAKQGALTPNAPLARVVHRARIAPRLRASYRRDTGEVLHSRGSLRTIDEPIIEFGYADAQGGAPRSPQFVLPVSEYRRIVKEAYGLPSNYRGTIPVDARVLHAIKLRFGEANIPGAATHLQDLQPPKGWSWRPDIDAPTAGPLVTDASHP